MLKEHEFISVIDKEKLLINSLIDIVNVPEADIPEYLKHFTNYISTIKLIISWFIDKSPNESTHLVYINHFKWVAKICKTALICLDEDLNIKHLDGYSGFENFKYWANIFIHDFLTYGGGIKCKDCGRVCGQHCMSYKHFIKKI